MRLLQSMRWKTNATKHSSGCSDRWRWEMKTNLGSSAIRLGQGCVRMGGLARSFTRLLTSYPQTTRITQNQASRKEAPRLTRFLLISFVPFMLFLRGVSHLSCLSAESV